MTSDDAAPAKTGLDIGRMHSVRAIGLDTNAFGSRHLSLARLVKLIERARDHGALEIWLPITVVWEWAEHAAAELRAASAALEHVVGAGVGADRVPSRTSSQVLDEMLQDLRGIGHPLVLIDVSDVASDALKDQVLLTGPAKTRITKDGSAIKTGASDSATLRAMMQEAEDDASRFVVVSADRDVERAFRSWTDEPPVVFKNLHDATRAVFGSVRTDAQIEAHWLTLAAATIPDATLGRLSGDVLDDLFGDRYPGEFANVEAYADEDTVVVGLKDVEIDREEKFVSATVFLLGVVTASGVVQDSSGDAAVQDWVDVHGASIRITATADLVEGSPQGLLVDAGEGVASRPEPDVHWDAEEAFAAVVDVLTTLPGHGSFDWYFSQGDDLRELVLPGGRLLLSLARDQGEFSWVLTATYRGHEREIRCVALSEDASFRRGYGLRPHSELQTDGVGLARWNPAWAINEMVVKEMTESLEEWSTPASPSADVSPAG